MIRRLLSFTLILLCAAFTVHAQPLDAFKQRLAQPVPGAALFAEARVNVAEHGDAARAVADAARAGQRLRVSGYRVCIFFDNGQDARAGAEAAKKLFEETYPGEKAYMVYEVPYFKVSVGNCLTSEEAVILKGRVSGVFPKAFLKTEVLSLSDLLDQ